MRLLTEREALPILGPLEDAVVIPGFTLILNDVNQYMGVSNSRPVLVFQILTLGILALLPLVG